MPSLPAVLPNAPSPALPDLVTHNTEALMQGSTLSMPAPPTLSCTPATPVLHRNTPAPFPPPPSSIRGSTLTEEDKRYVCEAVTFELTGGADHGAALLKLEAAIANGRATYTTPCSECHTYTFLTCYYTSNWDHQLCNICAQCSVDVHGPYVAPAATPLAIAACKNLLRLFQNEVGATCDAEVFPSSFKSVFTDPIDVDGLLQLANLEKQPTEYMKFNYPNAMCHEAVPPSFQSLTQFVSTRPDDVSMIDEMHSLHSTTLFLYDPTGKRSTQLHFDPAFAQNTCLYSCGAGEGDVVANWVLIHHSILGEVKESFRKGGRGEDVFANPRYPRLLTKKAVKSLQKQHGSRVVLIEQTPGMTVLVPPGYLHQVENVKPCLKVAIEYVPLKDLKLCFSKYRLRTKEFPEATDYMLMYDLLDRLLISTFINVDA